MLKIYDGIEIPSHCRFVIQNKYSMIKNDFMRLIKDYWMNDGDLSLLDIEKLKRKCKIKSINKIR